MQAVLANQSVSVSDLKKNPSDVVAKSKGKPVAVLNHNQVMAYLVPREAYEAMIEMLEDAELGAIVERRKADPRPRIRVKLDDL